MLLLCGPKTLRKEGTAGGLTAGVAAAFSWTFSSMFRRARRRVAWIGLKRADLRAWASRRAGILKFKDECRREGEQGLGDYVVVGRGRGRRRGP